MQIHESAIYTKVCQKYTIMKMRHKISYMAFMQGKTIAELIVGQILKSFLHFQKEGIIPFDKVKEERQNYVIRLISNNDSGTLKMLLTDKVVEDDKI
jgi:hypothetical protein